MKKLISILLITLAFAGCDTLKGIQVPKNIVIPYNCFDRIEISNSISIGHDCKGTDSLFIGEDTIILIANQHP